MGLSHKERRDRMEEAIRLYIRNKDNVDFDYKSFTTWLGVHPDRLRKELKRRGIWRKVWRSYMDYHSPSGSLPSV